MSVSLPHFRCPFCSHEWTPRSEVIKKCPRCQKSLPYLLESVELTVSDVITKTENEATALKSETDNLCESIQAQIPQEPALRRWSQIGQHFVEKIEKTLQEIE